MVRMHAVVPRRGHHLVLVGMMGSGKSAVGREVARRLDRPFLDNDGLLEMQTGHTAEALLERDGESGLHRLEAAVLIGALNDETPAVVTAAAGVVLDEDCCARLDAAGFVIWLRARSATLADRIEHSGEEHRPFVADQPGAVLERLAPQREPRYAAIADAIVDTDDLSVGTIATDVVVQFRAAG
jgi:shikimate kinase